MRLELLPQPPRGGCTGATADAVRVDHRDCPGLQAAGESVAAAAADLVQDLRREMKAVVDDLYRGPLPQAWADVRAFLDGRSDRPEHPRVEIASAEAVSRFA